MATINDQDVRSRIDPCAASRRARPRQVRLARHVAHVLLQHLLRSGPHGLPVPAGHQRGPGGSRARASGCTATGTWRSSPTSWKGPWSIGTAWAPARCCGRASSSACRPGRAFGTASSIRPRPNRSTSTRSGSCRTRRDLRPATSRRLSPKTKDEGRLRLVASPDAQDGSLLIHQDARVYLSTLDADQEIQHELQPGRSAWLQVLRGSVVLNGHSLATSDGAAVSDETVLSIRATEPSEVLLV